MLYREMGYHDFALQHLRTYLGLMQARGESKEVLQNLTTEQDRLSRLVQNAERAFAEESKDALVLERATIALRHGLAEKARAYLLDSDRNMFGVPGVELELRLLLETGRAAEAARWMKEVAGLRDSLGKTIFDWDQVQALAALGDYRKAMDDLGSMADPPPTPGQPIVQARDVMALSVGQAVLDATRSPSTPLQPGSALVRGDLHRLLLEPTAQLQQQASVRVLLGLLELEPGDVSEARARLRQAVALWKDETAAADGGSLDFGGRQLAQAYLELLEPAVR
jgi:tetratricopeptide (TPR) repeat protein